MIAKKQQHKNISKAERRNGISGPAKPSHHERGLAILNEQTKTEEWTPSWYGIPQIGAALSQCLSSVSRLYLILC